MITLALPATAVVYVSPNGNDTLTGATWAKAKASIQAGIDAANAKGGDKVYVMTGTYGGGITLKNGVTLRGGYTGSGTIRDIGAYPTVIDAGGRGTAIKLLSGTSASIDGIQIGNGSGQNGGAINCNSSALTISNCAFYNNYAAHSGGAIYAISSSLSVTGCKFSGSVAGSLGGALYASWGDTTVTDSTFTQNTAHYGGAISTDHSVWSYFLRDTLTGNSAAYGGGMSTRWASNTPVLNCVISNNSATNGGGLYYYQCKTLQASNLIQGNAAQSMGGGVYWGSYCFSDSVNDTIIANSSYQGGGVCAVGQNTGWVANAIFYDNYAPESGAAYKDRGSVLDLHNCCCSLNGDAPFSNGMHSDSSYGNKQADPLFVNYVGGDYHIRYTSPCLNAGDDWYVKFHTDWRDLDNKRRIVRHVDIGCYELQ